MKPRPLNISLRNERIGIDNERREAQEQLSSEGCDIPTLCHIEIKQKSAARLHDKLGLSIEKCWRDPGRTRCYEIDICKCPASCPRAFHYTKLDHLPRAIELIEGHSDQQWFVTLAHPKWRCRLGDLNQLNIAKAKADLIRWLKAPGLDRVVGLGAFEVSLNVELDKSCWWQCHVHAVFAGASKPDLAAALEVSDRSQLLPNEKPLFIVPTNSVASSLGYALKGDVEVRVAYLHANGRQHRSKDRLKAYQRDEYQRWINSVTVDQLLTFVGMRRYGGTLHLTAKIRRKAESSANRMKFASLRLGTS